MNRDPDIETGEKAGEDDFISKTRIKKQMLYLQDLGKQLVDLPENALKKIPLDDHLRESIELARRISARGGKKRQLQYIGKLLRSMDVSIIEQALDKRRQGHQQDIQHFQLLENWRDRLVDDDKAIEEFIVSYPGLPIQELRQLVRQSRKEASLNKPPKSSRKLFSWLKEHIEQN